MCQHSSMQRFHNFLLLFNSIVLCGEELSYLISNIGTNQKAPGRVDEIPPRPAPLSEF